MSHLNENSIALLSSTNVDCNAVAATNLFTVPTGKKLVVSHVILRNLSADANNLVLTLGQSGAKTDFLGAQTLSNLNAAASAGILQPIPNATTVELIEYTAAEIFVVDVTTAAGAACTADFDVYGTLKDV